MTLKGTEDLVFPSYYEELDLKHRTSFLQGQLYYGHVRYPFPYPKILALEKYDSSNEANTTFRMKNYSHQDKSSFPIKMIEMRHDERLYIQKGKIRLVIVLGGIEGDWFGIDKEAVQKIIFCAPVFSFKERHTQEFVLRVQAFQYPNLFYLPPSLTGCEVESAIRFELCQPIERNALQAFRSGLNNRPVRLTDDVYMTLVNQLARYYLNKEWDEVIDLIVKEYSEELIKEIEKNILK